MLSAVVLSVRADDPPATRSGPSTTQDAPPTTAPADGPAEPIAGRTEGGQSINLRREGEGAGLWKLLAYTLILLVLAGVAVFVLKRYLPKLGVNLGTGKNINVLETVHLGPKKTVHLLKVGSRTYLVAGTGEQVSILADVSDAVSDETGAGKAGPEAADGKETDFRTALERQGATDERGEGGGS